MKTDQRDGIAYVPTRRTTADRSETLSQASHSGLRNWLLGLGDAPNASVLRASRLTAYAYGILPNEHPERARLRSDYIQSLGRHLRMKRDLIPLLRAWRSNGIDVMLFKGFQLSEFVYPRPGARFHGDIDVLLVPDQVARAERIARDLGWQSARPPTWKLSQSHNGCCLERAGTRIDAHSQILHVVLPWYPTQRRITTAVWEHAWTRWWNGIDIREPSPVDMLLVGLVLQRCWSPEEWQLKPHDIVDFRCITSLGVTRDDLWQRAKALRCERTLAAFLERCDPDANRLELTRLSPSQRRRLHWAAFRERGLLGTAESRVARACRAPFSLALALKSVPVVLRVRRALRRDANLRTMLGKLCATQPKPVSSMPRELVVAGVRWATRLVGTGPFGACLVRALATFVALRQHGWNVEFVSGVRRDGSAIVGHAWVEYAGAPLLEMDQLENCARFEQNFRYPGAATTSAIQTRVPVLPIRDSREEAEPVPQRYRD